MATQAMLLGPISGVYQPDYQLAFYRNGDPRHRIPASQVNLGSVTAIQTSKAIGDLAGTFTITLKDGRARARIREMDTVVIKLAGHADPRMLTVLRGVVDRVRGAGAADVYASREDTIIEGRCSAKYLQVTSLFLPVWDPQALLPTALTFGLGDSSKKVGGNRPYDIFRYLVRKYTYGEAGNVAGLSGVANSKFWLDHYSRFAKSLDFQVPFLQFDEDTVMDALKRMEVLGFTETWVDELGRVVYRQPGWDQPVAYRVHTDDLVDWDLDRGDVDCSTYVEVIPAGDPGIDSATAQALRAGRAPVPSSYLKGNSLLAGLVDPDFIIKTDGKGVPTAEGEQNHWLQVQRRLGTRPQQITSPLIFTQEQAQAQAQGLLRFFTRMIKGGTIVLPGAPQVRLGHTIQVYGELDSQRLNRAFYIEGVQHDYVFGDHYTTTLTLSHGRDPWDPKWSMITLPRYDPAKLSTNGGILDPNSTPSGPEGNNTPMKTTGETNGATGDGAATDVNGFHATKDVTSRLSLWTKGGSHVWICKWMLPQLLWAVKQGWSGTISEGWRSIHTQEQYAHDGKHTIGVNVAVPGTSNHGLSIYPGGAIDTPDYTQLARILKGWKASYSQVSVVGPLAADILQAGRVAAMHGAGYALPHDVPHFSATGN